jgi:HlyD family secretion protein
MKRRYLMILNNFLILIQAVFLFNCGNSNNSKKIEVSGTIETTDVTISSKVSGEIKKLYFDEGAFVKKNDTLAEIDKINLLIQAKQAEGGVLLADAQLQMTVRGSRIEDIQQAEAALKQSKANLESAELDKNRNESLFKTKSISEKQWDDIRIRYQIALEQFHSADELFKKSKRGSRVEDIEVAKARRIQSEAQLDLIKKQLNDCYIIAPMPGVLSHKVFEEGELVMTGSNLFTISKLDKVFLMVYVNEQNLGKVKYGQKVEIKVDSHPEQIFTGIVTYISSTAEFTPKNIQTKEDRTKLVFGVKVEIENQNQILKPGMPADASIIISE